MLLIIKAFLNPIILANSLNCFVPTDHIFPIFNTLKCVSASKDKEGNICDICQSHFNKISNGIFPYAAASIVKVEPEEPIIVFVSERQIKSTNAF